MRIPSCGFKYPCQWNLYSTFQSFAGFLIPWAKSRIPKPKIPDYTNKISRIWESVLTYFGWLRSGPWECISILLANFLFFYTDKYSRVYLSDVSNARNKVYSRKDTDWKSESWDQSLGGNTFVTRIHVAIWTPGFQFRYHTLQVHICCLKFTSGTDDLHIPLRSEQRGDERLQFVFVLFCFVLQIRVSAFVN